MAAKYDFTIDQGSTFSKDLQFNDGNGDPMDLTGYTFRGQMRELTSSSTIAATFTFLLANQNTDPGKVTMSLTAAETAAIVVDNQSSAERRNKKYAYDIERVASGGAVERMLQGVVTVSPEVTK